MRLQFPTLLQYPRSKDFWLLPLCHQKLIFHHVELLWFDFHRSSKKPFLCYSPKDTLPACSLRPRNPMWSVHLVREWTCLLPVVLLPNKTHALPLHPKCLGSLSKNLSDSNENHLVLGETWGVNHLFAGVHFPRKTQKQKFTSAMESDVPSIIFAY